MTDFDKILRPFEPTTIACPIYGLGPDDLAQMKAQLSDTQTQWITANTFSGKKGDVLALPGDGGAVDRVLFGTGGKNDDPFMVGALTDKLPDGVYSFADGFDDLSLATLAFLLGAYRFDRFKAQKQTRVVLVCPQSVDRQQVLMQARSTALARDLINTPANQLGPKQLQKAAASVARKFDVETNTIKGKKLKQGFPMIHAVGRGSCRPPRLIDFSWGQSDHPKITLVGKGVVFDTGGLDIKPSNSMLLMKKDMGGAANVLALAQMIMAANLPVNLRVLIPAVENAVGSKSYRPSDILKSRSGITVEVGNTDAEGRLVLADALSLADESSPEMVIVMATLTGAARVALGPDVPPFFVNDDDVAHQLARASKAVHDPLWRLPLWKPYETMLASKVADTSSTGSGFAGSITAALFLAKFVSRAKHHIHLDIYGWTPTAKPARPVGGDAQGIRALFEFLSKRYN